MSTGKDLTGQVAIITGGTRGIGWAICKVLHHRGASVIVTGSSPESVEAAKALAKIDLPGVEAVVADACSEVDMQMVIDLAEKRSDRFTCLVACAGKSWRGDVTESSVSDWDACLDLNLKSAFLAARIALPRLKGVPNANIVLVSSIWAVTATRKRVAYSVAKTALVGLARNLAIDHGPDGVRVNAVAPGYIETDLFKKYLRQTSKGHDLLPEIIKRHPLRRIGTPSDVGEAVGFLASPAAGFITGQVLVIDGGITAQFALADL